MSAERSDRESKQPPDSGLNQQLINQLRNTWEELPSEHQASVALELLEDVMANDKCHDVQEGIALRWPLETDSLAKTFPVVQITRNDLTTAAFTKDEIAQLSDDDLQGIGQTMRDHYVHDVFWPELEYVVTGLLEKKQTKTFRETLEETTEADKAYYAWMSRIDRHVHRLIGCSIYDLPDFDSRAMFVDGLSAGEAVSEVFRQPGLQFTEEQEKIVNDFNPFFYLGQDVEIREDYDDIEPLFLDKPSALLNTHSAAQVMAEAGLHIWFDVAGRHASGDWGDVTEEEGHLNDMAVAHGERITSVYRLGSGEELHVTTNRERTATWVKLAQEEDPVFEESESESGGEDVAASLQETKPYDDLPDG